MEIRDQSGGKENRKKEEDFDLRIHRMGIATALIVWGFFLAVPFGVCMAFGLKLDYQKMIATALPLAVTFGITGLCEKLSMAPVIGPGAVYLASSTGNVQNMKLPAALNAMNIMDCEQGSEKGRVISIIAVASSTFVTTAIVFFGMLFLAPAAAPFLSNPALQPAFDNMLPALLGPLAVPMVLKNPKASAVPFVYAVLFAIVLGEAYTSVQSLVMAAVILLSLGSFALMLKGRKKKG